ncbi:MAG: AI-2E family transporter [Gemmatimonadaceae bacterium]
MATPPSESVLVPDVDVAARPKPEREEPTPDIGKTGEALGSEKSGSIGITILTVLAVLYTLYLAREFLRPLVFAILLSFLLSPVIRGLSRLRIRPPLAAGIVVLSLFAIVGFGGYQMAGPAQDWVAHAPATAAAAQIKLRRVLAPLERVSKTAEQVAGATTGTSGPEPREVVVKNQSALSRIFGTTEVLVSSILEVSILLYFLLASGDLFLQKLIKVLPNLRDKRTAVDIARETEASISTYLLTTAMVNAVEGVVVAGAMYLLRMPHPLLWGTIVALLEFIPYLGALAMIALLSIVALTTFDSVGRALAVPATFLVINLVQGNFVSPMLLGHRLAVNPVALLVALAFWFYIWGVPGAFIAVPLLAAFKIFCDHIEALASVGEFLGTRDDDERRSTIR